MEIRSRVSELHEVKICQFASFPLFWLLAFTIAGGTTILAVIGINATIFVRHFSSSGTLRCSGSVILLLMVDVHVVVGPSWSCCNKVCFHPQNC